MMLLALMYFFLFGYLAFFYALAVSATNSLMTEIGVGAILCFGAVFVVLVLGTSGDILRRFSENAKKLKEVNATLEEQAGRVASTQKALEEKNAELRKTLDDFYTLRMGMQRDLEAGTVDQENKKLKARLDTL